ncbi:hypothetical protein L5515_018275 [Caenorhabditis briggsae]|uniref:Uncharacterized protein n=2 Tax=Caenorhabditis briggsae TaxID=6238 RepID=A0AAE9FFD8_CAEBR|nr:hypothetical protein L3Y34_012421 [Caenorhabditis briggsae]UMM42445.1 hypothetical protein L5515_018275 [Caenorhabditis briggsae]
MFQEKDVGQPKRWGCLVAVFVIMTVFNIAVVIIIRGLLDTEDEFDNPIIQGEMREELTAFLGIFTMTFFFCCCGCFCCGCACCRWCFFQFPYGVAKLWRAIPNLFVNNMDHFPIQKFKETEEAAPNEDHVANARGILSKKMNEKQSDRCAYENTGYQDIIEMERVPQPPRLILPPAASGRLRSQSIDVSAIV